jgi:UDP-2-acetamido-2,6-beta-L-arabino-hexul-4-ose reductase
MTTIGVTGGSGMLGWHIRCQLRAMSDARVVAPDRQVFHDESALDNFVTSCDAVLHIAGMNRGDDNDVRETNVALAESLVSACRRTAARPHIVFANSTHHTRDTPYGQAKRAAAEAFTRWAECSDSAFTDVILPHVFGELGRPFANSVVSTFCYQLAHGEQPVARDDAPLELLHAQRAAQVMTDSLHRVGAGAVQVPATGRTTSVRSLLQELRHLADTYRGGIVPDLSEHSAVELFNTMRSYLYPQRYPIAYDRKVDGRGSLTELVQHMSAGQTFVSESHPGVTRGNHFHTAKVERFAVLHGDVMVRIRRLFHDDVIDFPMSGTTPAFIDIPTLHTHNLTNVGTTTLVMAFWSNEIFDPGRPDTVAEPV